LRPELANREADAHQAPVGAGKIALAGASFFSVRSNAGLQSGLPVSLTDDE